MLLKRLSRCISTWPQPFCIFSSSNTISLWPFNLSKGFSLFSSLSWGFSLLTSSPCSNSYLTWFIDQHVIQLFCVIISLPCSHFFNPGHLGHMSLAYPHLNWHVYFNNLSPPSFGSAQTSIQPGLSTVRWHTTCHSRLEKSLIDEL